MNCRRMTTGKAPAAAGLAARTQLGGQLELRAGRSVEARLSYWMRTTSRPFSW